MTVEYLSAKLIEKAMSEQNAYVPPNRNLIVAAETLKKQQAEIARLQKDVDRYEEQNRALLDEQIPCACGYDDPNDVCGKHHPTFKRKLEGAHNDAIEAAAKASEDLNFGKDIHWWLNSTKHEVTVETCHQAAAAIRALKK